MVNYRSVADLDRDARRLARRLPPADLVVGIPRSGLLAANLVGLHWNCPVTDLDGLLDRRLLAAGPRLDGDVDWTGIESVLVLDDSVNTGSEMRRTRRRVDRAALPFEVTYAAVYVTPGGRREVDHWAAVVRVPRVFGWNLFHHAMLDRCVVVGDGVLWRRPTRRERADPAAYRRYLATATPLTLPTKRVGWVLTGRAAADREATAAWLAAHGVAYDRLVTLGRDDAPRGSPASPAATADAFAAAGARFLVEPSVATARRVVRRTGRPVYCVETDEMLDRGAVGRTARGLGDAARHHARQVLTSPLDHAARAVRVGGRLTAGRLGAARRRARRGR